jgi:hypothetical protein
MKKIAKKRVIDKSVNLLNLESYLTTLNFDLFLSSAEFYSYKPCSFKFEWLASFKKSLFVSESDSNGKKLSFYLELFLIYDDARFPDFELV